LGEKNLNVSLINQYIQKKDMYVQRVTESTFLCTKGTVLLQQPQSLPF